MLLGFARRHIGDDGDSGGEDVKEEEEASAVIVDARNVYESRVGHFAVPGVPTLLTNTRKYSSLPQVLEGRAEDLAGKHVFMYCTGGVRCERASALLRGLADSDAWGDRPKPRGIYQLGGGIQRYLERYGRPQREGGGDGAETEREEGSDPPPTATTVSRADRGGEGERGGGEEEESVSTPCLYRGKNFVFDPRRTDPVVAPGPIAGRCLLCSSPWDDYDNGRPPSDGGEARCRRCRMLILVCDGCRSGVRAWGEEDKGSGDGVVRPEVFCGPGGIACVDEGNTVDAVEILRG